MALAADRDDLLRDPPLGMTILDRGPTSVTLLHQRKGMGCMNVFFSVWITGWGAGCIYMLVQFVRGIPNREGEPVTIGMLLLFWVIWIAIGIYFLYLVTARKTIRLEEDRLVVRTQFFNREKVESIPRNAVERLVQVKDGGDDEDSFPSWGLELKGTPKINLIFRQPHATSLWLGRLVADWAGVEFTSLPHP